ncbi:MAG: hypothetical protein IJE16_07505 [Ruminococcus sp.]|nr:hypothetical protein [Ruminococcus sp.]
MKRIIPIISMITALTVLFCGCALSNNENTDSTTQATSDETSFISTTGNSNINDVLRIYEESLKTNIELYCEEYLTYQGSPTSELDVIESIITDDYYEQIKATSNYRTEDKDYEQATALNTLYYSDYSTASKNEKVLAQCYQTIIVDNKSTTYNTFYIFNMKYDEEKGWLIDSVEKPSYEYLEE